MFHMIYTFCIHMYLYIIFVISNYILFKQHSEVCRLYYKFCLLYLYKNPIYIKIYIWYVSTKYIIE